MEVVVGLGTLAAMITGAIGLLRWEKRVFQRWFDVLQEVCNELDLEFDMPGRLRTAKGTKMFEAGNLTIDIIKHTPRGRSATLGVTRIMVNATHQIPNHLEFERGTDKRANTGVSVGNVNVRTGDRKFDDAVYVRGDPAETISLLDETTRGIIVDFVDGCGGVVAAGLLEVIIPGICTDKTRLVGSAQVAVDVARQLSRPPSEAPKRLANNAQNDPVFEVRLTNLQTLASRYPESRELKSAALKALEEESAAIRLVAGRHAGSKGYTVLLDLARSSETPEPIRLEATRLVSIGKTSKKESVAVLRSIVKDAFSPHSVCLAAIKGLGNHFDRGCVDLLVEQLEREDTALKLAIVHALGKIDHPESERHLLKLLALKHSEIRCAAAQWLGRIGSVKAVESLLRCTEGDFDRGTRKAAREAIALIQSRLGDVDEGSLSLVSDTEGEGGLSMAEQAGQLSEVDGKPAEPDPGNSSDEP